MNLWGFGHLIFGRGVELDVDGPFDATLVTLVFPDRWTAVLLFAHAIRPRDLFIRSRFKVAYCLNLFLSL